MVDVVDVVDSVVLAVKGSTELVDRKIDARVLEESWIPGETPRIVVSIIS